MSRTKLSAFASMLLLGMFCFCPVGNAGVPRFAHDYATGGDGSSGNPWTGWAAAIAADTEVVFVKGFFRSPSTAITVPSGVVLRGEHGSVVEFPSSRSNYDPIFSLSGGTHDVTIRGLEFEAGVTVPVVGVASGGGGSFIGIGTVGSSSVVSDVTIADNLFGVFRYTDLQQGLHIYMVSSVNNLTVRDNTFDAAPVVLGGIGSDSSVSLAYNRITFDDNLVRFTQTHHNFGAVFGFVGIGSTIAGTFDQLTIRNNTVREQNGTFDVGIGGKGLLVAGNDVRSDNMDGFMFLGNLATGPIEDFTVAGNECYADDPSGSPDKVLVPTCHLIITNTLHGVVVGNNFRAHAGGISYSLTQIKANLSKDMLVSSNAVDLGATSTSSYGEVCYSAVNSSLIRFVGNICRDSGNYAFVVSGTSRDVTIDANDLVTTGSNPITTNFASCAGTNLTVTGNQVRGQSLTDGFVVGPVTNLKKVGNTESVGQTDWGIANSRLVGNGGSSTTITLPPRSGTVIVSGDTLAGDVTGTIADGSTSTTVNWTNSTRSTQVDFQNVTTALTWSNMPAAVTEVYGTAVRRVKFDVSVYKQFRLEALQQAFGTDVGASLRVQYSTDQSSWSDLAQTGGAGDLPVATTTGPQLIVAGSWSDIATAAKTSGDVYLRLVGLNGDGVADPSWYSFRLQLK